MDPFLIMGGISLVLGLLSKHRYRKAIEAYRDAAIALQSSQQVLIEAMGELLCASIELAANRQAAHDSHWRRLKALLPQQIKGADRFAAQSEDIVKRLGQEIQAVISETQELLVGRKRQIGPGASTAGIVCLLRGAKLLDVADAPHLSFLHSSLKELVSNLPEDTANGIVTAFGGLGDLPIADVFSGALIGFSVIRSVNTFQHAEEVHEQSSRLRAKTSRLNDAFTGVDDKTKRIDLMFKELKGPSYELFKMTILAQEFDRAGRERIHTAEPGQVVFPKWVLLGLRVKAAALWSQLERSVLGDD